MRPRSPRQRTRAPDCAGIARPRRFSRPLPGFIFTAWLQSPAGRPPASPRRYTRQRPDIAPAAATRRMGRPRSIAGVLHEAPIP
ncbi:hypothetical protein [Lysobacter gummosus]|uniref:hypothetical protein n=1 Tax=Lysobacter gummosus TaxID=262324 RepID=UPI003629A291